MSKKIYIIAYSNNVGDGLYFDESCYTSIKEARKALRKSYNDIKGMYEKCSFEECEIGDWSYFIMRGNCDTFRAMIQDFQIEKT